MSIYETVTARMLAELERGTVPWQKPWTRGGRVPFNLFSRKPYRGANVPMLAMQAYERPEWLTFKQADSIGAHVRKGEKGTPIVFWKFLDRKEEAEAGEEGEKRGAPMLRMFHVFNVEQCEGIPAHILPEYVAPPAFQAIESAAAITARYAGQNHGPRVEHGGDVACYRPSLDLVQMPKPEAFVTAPAYYSTLFHELVHSTGHRSRLARDGVVNGARFASHEYSREELVAELGACFLRARAGIEEVPEIRNSAAYLASWMRALKKDARLLLQAAAQAQKASDLIAGPAEEGR